MLIKTRTLNGYTLDGRDGRIGEVQEFYFDDQYWTIRYLIAGTGSWLSVRQVLISPYSLGGVSTQDHSISVDLTKKQIADSPSLDSDKPVSRQFEESYYGYYGYPTYWSGPYMWGTYPGIVRERAKWRDVSSRDKGWDPRLRSTREVRGYRLQAGDGEIGHVEDFIVDDESWAIRYLIVDTKNWWPGKKILLSPQWIERVSWGDSKVFVGLPREVIKQSPPFGGEMPLSRDYETELHRHYRRQGYWVEEPVVHGHSRS
jgi:hypothetical protein